MEKGYVQIYTGNFNNNGRRSNLIKLLLIYSKKISNDKL